MTCKEKLKMEYPEKTRPSAGGGCEGCPDDYGYLDKPSYCGQQSDDCEQCWGREIPGTDIQEILTRTLESIQNEPAVIKDSGDRTQFATGAVRDMHEGKGRCDLMPLHVLGDFFNDGIFTHLAHYLENPTKSDHLYSCLDMAWHMWDSKPTMFLEVAKHFEEGAKKYGENNWQKGIPVNCYIDSAVRHYLKWLRGDKDEHHERAFVWNLICCIWEVDFHSKREGETE